jgi:hypothetical protein
MKALLVAALSMALAASASADTTERLVDAGRVFPLLDKFIAIAPADRSRLALGYRVTEDGRAPTDVRLTLVSGGRRTPLPLAPDGQVERLPVAADFASHAEVAIAAPKGAKLAAQIELSAAIPSAPEIAAADCALAITQGQAAVRRAAGMMALLAPRITKAVFVGSGSGVAVGADGQSRPLPLVDGQPAYDPAALKDAKVLRLAKAPVKIELQ